MIKHNQEIKQKMHANIRSNVSAFKKKNKMTDSEFCRLVDISTQVMTSNKKEGRTFSPVILYKIAHGMGTTIDKLVGPL